MNIAFFTEGGYQGKVPRNHPNLRTELAWMCALEATHYPIPAINQVQEEYDLGIIIIPKKNIDVISQIDIIGGMRNCCKKIAFMQEGPAHLWEDYSLAHQIWFYNTLVDMDYLFCHNGSDMDYFHGLTGKTCFWMPSLMIEDNIKGDVEQEDAVIIGGNMVSWYGGMTSYMSAQRFNLPVYAPSMGRKVEGEEQLDNLNHLAYMQWGDWIEQLKRFKYGVHLMRTFAAGTFSLNCAAHGIPCVGYGGLDSQSKCHVFTTVDLHDITEANARIDRLRDDKTFYEDCSGTAKEYYNLHFSEAKFKERFYSYF